MHIKAITIEAIYRIITLSLVSSSWNQESASTANGQGASRATSLVSLPHAYIYAIHRVCTVISLYVTERVTQQIATRGGYIARGMARSVALEASVVYHRTRRWNVCSWGNAINRVFLANIPRDISDINCATISRNGEPPPEATFRRFKL